MRDKKAHLGQLVQIAEEFLLPSGMKIQEGDTFHLYSQPLPPDCILVGLPIVSASAPHVYFEVPKEAIRI